MNFMKIIFASILVCTSFSALSIRSQGFIYDQQSANEFTTGEAGINLITGQPAGQSFTPAFSAIDFVSLQLVDANWGNGIGATVFVNIFSGSLTNGTLLGSSTPVFLPDSFGVGGTGVVGITNFLFSSSVAVTAGATYYLQPILQSGDTGWEVEANVFNYPGGTAYYQGAPAPLFDLWFREGILAVPEPSVFALGIFGGVWLFARRRRIRPT